MLRYKVVEVTTVTEDALTDVLNRTTRDGWGFDAMHFAMREGGRRPAMAFLVFTRDAPDDDGEPPVARETH